MSEPTSPEPQDRGSTPMLFGRSEVVEALEHLLEGADEHAGGAVILRGGPGIGKTAVVAAVQERAAARGMRVLVTTGVPSETNLPFAGLHQLVRPLLGGLNRLPAPQREALEAAFGMSSESAPDRFRIALAALELLGEASTAQSLLLVSEDAHWLDGPTVEVLAFVARRLRSDPIVLVLAVRDGGEDAFARAGLPEIPLAPLDDASSRALLERTAPDLASEARERVLLEASGNPLALVELPKSLPPLGAIGSLPQEPIPLTARLEGSFVSRVAELPSATRTVLLIAAADESLVVDDVLRAGELVGVAASAADALAPAISQRLIALEEARIRFGHPLMRSAIYDAAGVDERMRVHAALAIVLEADPDRSIWHRAAAAVGHDEDVCLGLEEAAGRALRRGAPAVSVAALQRASSMSTERARQAALLVRAAELAADLGGRAEVAELAARAERYGLGQLERARLLIAQEILGTSTVDDEAHTLVLVESATRASAAGESELADTLLTWAATRCVWGAHRESVCKAVLDAATTLHPRDDPWAVQVLAYVGPFAACRSVRDRLAQSTPDAADALTARYLGSAALLIGDFRASSAYLTVSANGYRAQGRLGMLPRLLIVGAWEAGLMGDPALARVRVEEGMRLAAETGADFWTIAGAAVAAALGAIYGDAGDAEVRAAEAIPRAALVGARFVVAIAQQARGLAALAAGRYEDAYDHLRRILDPGDHAFHPVHRRWVLVDLAEAASHCDRVAEAKALVGELEAHGGRIPGCAFDVGLSYASAVLADEAEAEERFDAALAADLGSWPLQRARLLLAYGSWLRRRRRPADSRLPLREARDLFDALGVEAWGNRAREELRASGETSRKRTPLARDRLTSQELQIAQLAASGLTNRQIGSQLFLSHRTVGSHLYRVYPKLGITSRVNLRTALAESASS